MITRTVQDDIDVQAIRDDMGIQLWKPVPELSIYNSPTVRKCTHTNNCGQVALDDDCVETIVCPCGEEHDVVATAYGRRAQCDELDVRWTSVNGELMQFPGAEIRLWVAEPYTSKHYSR